MQPVLSMLCLPLALAFAPASIAQEAKSSVAHASLAEVFPAAREGLTINADRQNADASTTVLRLVDEFTRVTGIAVQMTKETQALAQASPLGLNRSIQVPASEVYRIVETLLAAQDFAVIHLSDVEPRIWKLQSLAAGGRGSSLLAAAQSVGEDELDFWRQHPATLVSLTLELPNLDVRTLSNSMRTLFTDANTQNIIPVGSNGLTITGLARDVPGFVRMLRRIDALSTGSSANEVRARGGVQSGQERK